MKSSYTAIASLALVLFATNARLEAAPPPAKLAFTGARVITVSGKELSAGTVLVDSGKIVAVGADVAVPYDYVEIEIDGKVLFPGMIHPHSASGLDRTNEPRVPVSPYVDVYDALDPSKLFFEDCLRRGITSVHVIPGNNCVIGGASRVVRPIGRTPDEMTVRSGVALKLVTTSASDRMLQMYRLRHTFAELDEHLGAVAEKRYAEVMKERGEIVAVGPDEARGQGREHVRDEDIDVRYRNLAKLTQGRIDGWVYAGDAMDVAPAVELARDHGFFEHSVFVIGGDAIRAIDTLKAAGRPVVLPVDLRHVDRDPATGEITETFLPSVVSKAGLPFALQASSDGSLAERFLTYQAARCVRQGLSRDAAYRAITLTPATMLGMGDRLGSIEVGKIANLVVFSGDPLDFNSVIEDVYIDGIHAYDRKRDHRLRELLPTPTATPQDEKNLKANGDPTPPVETDDTGDKRKPEHQGGR